MFPTLGDIPPAMSEVPRDCWGHACASRKLSLLLETCHRDFWRHVSGSKERWDRYHLRAGSPIIWLAFSDPGLHWSIPAFPASKVILPRSLRCASGNELDTAGTFHLHIGAPGKLWGESLKLENPNPASREVGEPGQALPGLGGPNPAQGLLGHEELGPQAAGVPAWGGRRVKQIDICHNEATQCIIIFCYSLIAKGIHIYLMSLSAFIKIFMATQRQWRTTSITTPKYLGGNQKKKES